MNPLNDIAPDTSGTGLLFAHHVLAFNASFWLFVYVVAALWRYRRADVEPVRRGALRQLDAFAAAGVAVALVIVVGVVAVDALKWWPLTVLEAIFVLGVWSIWRRVDRESGRSRANTLGPKIERIP